MEKEIAEFQEKVSDLEVTISALTRQLREQKEIEIALRSEIQELQERIKKK